MDGYVAIRNAVRDGIVAADAEPVMAEDFVSSDTSPRNACLNGVASTDGLVVVVGNRGGWKAPSGKLVVEEEVEEAVRCKIPVLVFVEEVDRDSDAEQLVRRLSDYTEGRFRTTFGSETELTANVSEAVSRTIVAVDESSRMERLARCSDLLQDETHLSQDAVVRIAVVPERAEEIFDPLKFDDDKFVRRIIALGHEGDPPLLDYQLSTSHRHTAESFSIQHNLDSRTQVRGPQVEITIYSDGAFKIDLSVSRPRETGGFSMDVGDSFVISEARISSLIGLALELVHRVYSQEDKYRRYERFFLNTRVINLGYRQIGEKTTGQTSYPVMGSMGEKELFAFVEPRLVSRPDIENSGELVRRVVEMLKRRQSN